MTYISLPRSFFARNTHNVAQDLLGKLLVRKYQNKTLAGRITEVESYVGEDDRACHASKGRTARTEVMFGEAGHAYVYFIYGMYNMLNIVTEEKDFPAAVLIRSLQLVQGREPIMRQRNFSHSLPPFDRLRASSTHYKLTNGPGKLTRALKIDRSLNNEDLTTSKRLHVADDGFKIPKNAIQTSSRIGVEYAGPDAFLPWRYYVKDSLFVSDQKKL